MISKRTKAIAIVAGLLMGTGIGAAIVSSNLNFEPSAVAGGGGGISCPTTSRCGSGNNGVEDYGAVVPLQCKCPDGTYYKKGDIDRTAQGGPYRMCRCNGY